MTISNVFAFDIETVPDVEFGRRLHGLPAPGRVQLRMIVPVQVGPDGGIGVEVFTAARVAQHGAPAGHDDDRLAPQPVAHLGEGTPDVGVVELGERVHFVFTICDLRVERAP